jgi:hypothetical protein
MRTLPTSGQAIGLGQGCSLTHVTEHPVEFYRSKSLFVSATRRRDGSLMIEGQDLGGDFFSGEYEYAITVRPDDVPRVVEALGGAPGEDPLALLQAKGKEIVELGEKKWLEGLGLTVKFWSHY